MLSREDLIEYLQRITGFKAQAEAEARAKEEADAASEAEAEANPVKAAEDEDKDGDADPDAEGNSDADADADADADDDAKAKAKAKTGGLSDDDIEEVVDQLFLECVDSARAAPGKRHGIVVADYIRIVALSEFLTKLRITI